MEGAGVRGTGRHLTRGILHWEFRNTLCLTFFLKDREGTLSDDEGATGVVNVLHGNWGCNMLQGLSGRPRYGLSTHHQLLPLDMNVDGESRFGGLIEGILLPSYSRVRGSECLVEGGVGGGGCGHDRGVGFTRLKCMGCGTSRCERLLDVFLVGASVVFPTGPTQGDHRVFLAGVRRRYECQGRVMSLQES